MRVSNNKDKKQQKEESEDEESSEESRSEEESADGSEDSVSDVAVKTPERVATTGTLPALKEKKIAVDSGTPKGKVCKKSEEKMPAEKRLQLQNIAQPFANSGSQQIDMNLPIPRKRRSEADHGVAIGIKRFKKEEILELLQSSDEESIKENSADEESMDEEMSAEALIQKAEKQVLQIVDLLTDDNTVPQQDIDAFHQLCKYGSKVVKVRKSNSARFKENSPIWGHDKGDLSLQMLHSLQTVLFYVADVLYVNAHFQGGAMDPNTKMLSTYMSKYYRILKMLFAE